ncbi:non-ribosomal peptide synthetase [Consotaella aegiceratis]|uniref:non-ribosomal peptide synthetase n=1 Tax=Consotaella aegiceratis TaxID=3097961 RepID=UPI002F400434
MKDDKIQDILPLLPAQQGMLFQTMTRPDRDSFVVFLSMEIEGPLAPDVLDEAWQHVVASHDALRTGFFRLQTRSPVQVVFRKVSLAVEHLDWTNETDPGATLGALKEGIRATGFAFGRAPLMRVHLIRRGPSAWTMLWSYYHAILDGASVPPILKRVMNTYSALAGLGERPQFRVPQAKDHVRWWKSRPVEASEAFWRTELQAVTEAFVTDLELSPSHESGEPNLMRSEHRLSLTGTEQREVQEFARSSGVTVANLMAAAWSLVLSRFSDSDTVLFGAVQLGRDGGIGAPEDLVGCFIQTVPTRVTCHPNAPVLAWLQELQKAAADRMAHGHLGLARIQRCASARESQALFGTLLVVQPMPSDAIEGDFGDLSIGRIEMEESTDSPITAYAVVGQQIDLKLVGVGLAPHDLGRALQYWHEALVTICREPHAKLDQLTLTPDSDRNLLRQLSGRAEAEAHADAPDIITAIWTWAARQPGAPAVHDPAGSVAHGDLILAADRIAANLSARGVGPGDRVALMLSRKWTLVAAILGILRAGAVVVPIDPLYPQTRRAMIISDAAPKVLIHNAGAVDWVQVTDNCIAADIETLLTSAAPVSALPIGSMDCNHPAYIIYTSGSTGVPKGVILSRRNIAGFAAWARATYAGEDLAGVAAGTSVCFDLSIFEILVPLSAGGAVILCDTILSLPAHPRRAEVRLINTVPSAAEALLAGRAFPDTVTTLNLAGEPLKRETVAAIRAQTRVRQLSNLYGPSECTVYATAEVLDPDHSGKPLIGSPISGTLCVILDRLGRLAPIGAVGELYLGGTGVGIGYWQRDDLTADRFAERSVRGLGRHRFYRTGDLVRWRMIGGGSYRLEYLDRKDRMIKLNGYRVEPGEVEAVLRQHNEVADIAVCRSVLAGNQVLRAFVVPAFGSGQEPRELQEWLRDRLPAFMIPSHIAMLDALPLTLNGKIDYKALEARPLTVANPSPSDQSPAASDIAGRIAAIWKEVLGLDAVPLDRGFFELGGTSLSLLGVHRALVEAGFDELQVVDLLSHTTIAELAAHLDQGQAAPAQDSINAVKKRVAARRLKAAQRRRAEDLQ